MGAFEKSKLPDASVTIEDTTWERIDDYEESGVLYWERPYHHTDRDWNRHDIEIKGEADFPAYTIELTDFGEGEWGVKVMITQGPEDEQPGMGGVLEGEVVEGIEVASETIRDYMHRYDADHELND